jgi:predicted amidophosphoribosyltransferase
MSALCPFCDTAITEGVRCPGCGRDPTLTRRVCPRCQKMTPQIESTCSHCGAALGSELSWKIPLIVGLFIAAFALSIVIHLIGQ